MAGKKFAVSSSCYAWRETTHRREILRLSSRQKLLPGKDIYMYK
ncbi:hypothetical protein CCACVL1_28494 [Corchorus capsularis]|uniref:Uncharacterized protein n=1 Tax=Corchorus capsularis TaxID=210143 RepID=A0A1R3G6E3_COCAP|nr:hypothetical protein CCACVL1_28494 [Corchorus capsularis]